MMPHVLGAGKDSKVAHPVVANITVLMVHMFAALELAAEFAFNLYAVLWFIVTLCYEHVFVAIFDIFPRENPHRFWLTVSAKKGVVIRAERTRQCREGASMNAACFALVPIHFLHGVWAAISPHSIIVLSAQALANYVGITAIYGARISHYQYLTSQGVKFNGIR